MANSKEPKSIKLNDKAVINCPYCGNGNRINDLLFRTSAKLSVAEDNRLSDYYFRYYGRIPKENEFKEGWTQPRRLISWTDFPNSQVTVNSGFVTAVSDYDGETAEERACIWCHNKISDDWISRAGRDIVIYAQPGTEGTVAQFIGSLIGGRSNAANDYNDLRCFIFENSIIYNCTALDGLDIHRRKRALMSGLASKAAVFFMQLEAANGDEEVMDLDTVEWLRNGVSEVYGANEIHFPTLVVLIPAPGNRADDVEATHKVLCTRLHVHFSNYRIYEWWSSDRLAKDFTELMGWLIGNK